MSERDAVTIKAIRQFQGQAEMCAHQMRLNALYIQRELPNVRMSDELLRRTTERCTGFIGTEHKLFSELVELEELLKSGGSNEEVLERIERMVEVAWNDALQMHEIVMALDAELHKGVMDGGAYLLVSESAVNILNPLHEMRQLAAQLTETLS